MESYLHWGEGFVTYAIADTLIRSDVVPWPIACVMGVATGNFLYKTFKVLEALKTFNAFEAFGIERKFHESNDNDEIKENAEVITEVITDSPKDVSPPKVKPTDDVEYNESLGKLNYSQLHSTKEISFGECMGKKLHYAPTKEMLPLGKTYFGTNINRVHVWNEDVKKMWRTGANEKFFGRDIRPPPPILQQSIDFNPSELA